MRSSLYNKNHQSSICQQNFQSRGFTLIEIMVVVAIIGVMVAYLGISLSRDFDRLAALEAKRFHVIVNEVRDEAILTGEAYLLVVDTRANTFYFSGVRSDRKINNDDGLLQQREIEKGVEVDWEVFDQFDDDEDNDPKVLISPLGDITPFEVFFTGDNNKYFVFINENGQLERRTEKNNVH